MKKDEPEKRPRERRARTYDPVTVEAYRDDRRSKQSAEGVNEMHREANADKRESTEREEDAESPADKDKPKKD